ncbi:MAG: tetratricopeptide repeat protein, partial [Actinobacteria bacterium]|nr:tetratricopeptide repeat protein [Actinomycetota bacterium]
TSGDLGILAPADFIRVRLPIAVELYNGGGRFELTIPADNSAINSALAKCAGSPWWERPKEVAAKPARSPKTAKKNAAPATSPPEDVPVAAAAPNSKPVSPSDELHVASLGEQEADGDDDPDPPAEPDVHSISPPDQASAGHASGRPESLPRSVEQQATSPLSAANAITQMLDASRRGSDAELQDLKSRIEAMTKPAHGDRKVARALNDDAMAMLKDGRFAEAVNVLGKASVADPADIEIVDNLSYAALKAGQFEEAKRSSQSALLIAPGRSSAWANLGIALAQTPDETLAVAAFSNAYRFSGNQTKTVEYLNKLVADDSNPGVTKAAKTVLEAISAHPGFVVLNERLPSFCKDWDQIGGTKRIYLDEALTKVSGDLDSSGTVITPTKAFVIDGKKVYQGTGSNSANGHEFPGTFYISAAEWGTTCQ